jgi:hypothetical protein
MPEDIPLFNKFEEKYNWPPSQSEDRKENKMEENTDKILAPKVEKEKNQMLSKIGNAVNKFALITLIFFLFGISVGIWGAKQYFYMKMGEIVQVKGFVHDGNVFDVRLRVTDIQTPPSQVVPPTSTKK